jgi:hypothetical protein
MHPGESFVGRGDYHVKQIQEPPKCMQPGRFSPYEYPHKTERIVKSDGKNYHLL